MMRQLFISGYSDDPISVRGVHADAHFLAKPFTLEDLAAAVRGAVRGALR
jgi:FixJ family two-component response regulator